MTQWIFWIVFYAIGLGIGIAAGYLMGFHRGSRAARREAALSAVPKAFPCAHFVKGQCSMLVDRGKKDSSCPFVSAPESVDHCLYFKPLEK